MIQKQNLSFATIPSILLWLVNLLHGFFTWWAVDAGGTGMEMGVLFPIFFVEIPGMLVLLICAICMIVVRKNRSLLVRTAVPAVVYILQLLVFWLAILYK